ncbi:MAG: lytic transglycosylase domain-containing protein [Burkholderiaceae bacterium]|nr:lytic transglycosylase domain-containing protein [Burkholderiaceae bacterium]
MKRVLFLLLLTCALFAALIAYRPARAGSQQYEALSDSIRSALAAAVRDDRATPQPRFASISEKVDWLSTMSSRLPLRWKPEYRQRIEFLNEVRYEAQRAGLDPHLVLGLIEVESNFRRYAVSSAGARGYMQVMPFWTQLIGDADSAKLFEPRTNLRYGCTILRHYLDVERGDLFRALGRYNGSLGRAEYPNAVLRAWKRWQYAPRRNLQREPQPAPERFTEGAPESPAKVL